MPAPQVAGLDEQVLAAGLVHQVFEWTPLIAGRLLQMQMFARGDDFCAPRQRFPDAAFDDDQVDGRIFQHLLLAYPLECGIVRIALQPRFGGGIVFDDAGYLVVRRVEHGFELAGEMAVPCSQHAGAHFGDCRVRRQ